MIQFSFLFLLVADEDSGVNEPYETRQEDKTSELISFDSDHQNALSNHSMNVSYEIDYKID